MMIDAREPEIFVRAAPATPPATGRARVGRVDLAAGDLLEQIQELFV